MITEQILLKDKNGIKLLNLGNYIIHGQKTISAAGTQEVLIADTTQTTMYVTIKALHANTNMVYVGDSDVSSANGYVLDSGEEITLCVDNAKDNIYIDVDTNGEGVSYIGWYAY